MSNIKAQIDTGKVLSKTLKNKTNTDEIIHEVSSILSGRQDIDNEDYKELIEFVILQLNCSKGIPIEEVTKIANTFRNIEYSDINLLTEAFVNSDGKLPVDFGLDKDGSLLVTKQLTMDYSGVFAQSHRLLKTYVSANNVSGVKYELAKQWFILYLLENKIIFNKNKLKQKFISEKKKKEAIQIRSFILSDYKTYMKWVSKKDPEFNFNEYFKTTPFYKETFKIDKRFLQMILPM